MATGSSDVVLSLGVDGSAYTAGLRSATDEAVRAGRAIGAGFAPANRAVSDFGATIKNYKAEQSSQARTVSFFVRELTDVTGMSREAAGAVGGLGQVMLEAAAGGGAFAVGFEAVKFVVSQVIAEWRRAGEELKALEAVQLSVTASLMAGNEALAKMTAGVLTEGAKAFREVFDAGSKGIKGVSDEIEKLREKGPGWLAWIRAGLYGDMDAIDAFEAKIASMSQAIATITNNASNQAEIARALAQEGQKAAQAPAANKVLADDAVKAQTAATARAADQLKLVYENLATEMQRLADEEDRAVTVQAKRLLDLKKEMDDSIAESVRQDGLSGAFSGYEDTPRLNIDGGAAKELKTLNEEGRRTSEIMASIGDSIGSAFGSIGQIIGGAAGQFMQLVGRMIQQAVSLAISLAAASVAWTSPLGMAAIGAATLATLIGLIASVPSFDVGTLSVPRTGLAMIHAGEAILPAGGPAETYRAGLARSGARAGGATTVNVSMNISGAIDGPSVYRTLNGSRDQLARVIREAVRDGVMG